MKVFGASLIFTLLLLSTVTFARDATTSLRALQEGDEAQGNFFFGFFESLFNSFDGFFCWLLGINASCSCSESTLRRALGDDFRDVVRICKGSTIELSQEISLSGQNFKLDCVQEFGSSGVVTSDPCTLTGRGANRIFNGAPDGVTVKNIELKNARADKGAIALITGGTITFDNCIFEDSSATADGGALFITGATTTVNTNLGTVFKSNKAANGGAIFIEAGAGAKFADTRFVSNTCTGSGGAIAVTSADVELNGASFTNNVADTSGDDIRINDDADPAANGSFVDCTVSDDNGAVKFCQKDANSISELGAGILGSQQFDNTDCDSTGEAGSPTAPQCSTA